MKTYPLVLGRGELEVSPAMFLRPHRVAKGSKGHTEWSLVETMRALPAVHGSGETSGNCVIGTKGTQFCCGQASVLNQKKHK